jgi:PleD family two-component response regulator
MSSHAELLAAADRALYKAKTEGRDCVRVAPHEWQAQPYPGLELV